MKTSKIFLLCLPAIIILTGCFNHTLPTIKRLNKGEKIWGASLGMPFYTMERENPVDEENGFSITKEISWSIWYGKGFNDDTDYYIYVGELGGAGIAFNQELRESNISAVALNYGIGSINGIYGFRPKLGINYSEGGSINKKFIGLLSGLAYDFKDVKDAELIGDYELYAGMDNLKESHLSFGRVGIQKINKFQEKFFEISKWGPKFLSYKEWSKNTYRLNAEFGVGSIDK